MRVTIAGTCTVQAYARVGLDRAQRPLTGIDSYAGQIAGCVVDRQTPMMMRYLTHVVSPSSITTHAPPFSTFVDWNIWPSVSTTQSL